MKSSQIDVRTLGLLSNWWDESFGLIWCHHERLTSLGRGLICWSLMAIITMMVAIMTSMMMAMMLEEMRCD